jgi:hypothetical protein
MMTVLIFSRRSNLGFLCPGSLFLQSSEHRVHAAQGRQAPPKWPDGELGMLDIAMVVMGVVMFVLLLGYAPLCDKLT